MATRSSLLRTVVDDIRKRWRNRAIIRGIALSGVVALALSFVVLWVLTQVATSGTVVLAMAFAAMLVVCGVAWLFVAQPLRHPPTDKQIALYVEEQIPDLEDRFNAAIEVESRLPSAGPLTDLSDNERSAIIVKLLDDAIDRSRSIRPNTLLDRSHERWLAWGAGALLVLFLGFAYSVRDQISFSNGSIKLIGLPVEQLELSVTPGSTEIEKGASQEIIARLRSDSNEGVVVVWKEGEADWRRDVMIRGAVGEPVFLFELENIQQPVQYFIEQGDLRSEPFTLSLYEFPDIEGISVRIAHPSYTGLPVTTVDDTGDIDALSGSRATIGIQTTGTTRTAELVYSDGNSVPFEEGSSGSFSVTIPVERDDYYTVRLIDARDKQNRFPEEYRIEARDDLEPSISITDPRRDLRANAIEEVLIAAEASDDIGLKTMSLVYSVNAAEEKEVSLADALTKSTRDASGSHVFFLEDYSMQPGDVISYYVKVEDYLERPAPVATDMYFIEVIPFDQTFTQANNGGGGGGGGQQSGIVISQQQIIAATWKLIREAPKMEPDELDTAEKALIQAQANLKQNIEQRISSTAFSLELRASETQQQIVEHLRAATIEMDKAIGVLEEPDLKGALTPERMALNRLLRADALNRDQQVAANRGQNGGGGGGGAAQDRITELMDLELDISKDKYETQQQRSGGGAPEQSADEALNKVRELAARQEALAQRSRESQLEGEDKKRFIETLKRDQDEIKQQTKQLSNALNQLESENGKGREMQRQLDRVSENMEQSERALRRGDIDEAMTQQQKAINELERLQDQLRMKSTDDAREKVRRLAEDFDEFRTREKRLAEDIDKATAEAAARGGAGRQEADRRTAAELRQKREQMIDNLERLQETAEAVEREVRDDDPAAASAIRNMLQQIRRDGLEKNMQDSREALRQNWLDYADRKEDLIVDTVDELDDKRRALDGSLPVTDEERLARSMQDLRDLRSQLEDIEQEARNARGENSEAEGTPQEGQPGEGQRGEGQQNAGQGRGGDRDARAAQARMQRQIERARETLDRLQQNTGQNPQGQRQMDELRSFLTRADGTGVRLEGDAAADFFNKRAYDPLSQLEESFVRQLDLIQLEKKLYGAKRADVPLEYQELVDRYYESLSKDQ